MADVIIHVVIPASLQMSVINTTFHKIIFNKKYNLLCLKKVQQIIFTSGHIMTLIYNRNTLAGNLI